MNVFVIPSWYPSESNPIYGTFIREQCQIMAKGQPEINIGVSVWGQGDDRFLLWSRQPVKSVKKLVNRSKQKTKIRSNLVEYHRSAFTWTRKVLKGNVTGIIRANEYNMREFEADFGKPDIIHAQASYPAAIVARSLSEKWNIPYVVTIRMSPFPFPEFLTKSGELSDLIASPLHRAGGLIATSSSLKRTLEGFGFDKVRLIHNPVDLAFFNIKGEKAIKAGVNLVSVGRLVRQKGFDLLIQSMKRLVNMYDIQLSIVGEGPDRSKLERQIRDLNLSENMRLVGELPREKVRDQIQESDALILPSRHETFGNVLLEAMACGKQVVATRCGGPEDIVTNETGILCEKEDVGALTDAITDLIQYDWDPQKIRNYVAEKFSPDAFTEKMTGLYGGLKA